MCLGILFDGVTGSPYSKVKYRGDSVVASSEIALAGREWASHDEVIAIKSLIAAGSRNGLGAKKQGTRMK